VGGRDEAAGREMRHRTRLWRSVLYLEAEAIEGRCWAAMIWSLVAWRGASVFCETGIMRAFSPRSSLGACCFRTDAVVNPP